MVTRMKISRTLMLIIGLLVFASWELVAGTSIHDIDLQLYRKYGLDEKEIDFIETHVKEMA